MKVKVIHNNSTISSNILVADNPVTRIIGLMFRKAPPLDSDGLLLEPCNSIHTFFMRYALDIVFLDRKNEVVKILRNLKPWRMTLIYFKARKTLELPAGKLPLNIREGDILEVQNV
jgi:uncharacterized membrane protein (UPF0127 family)